MDPSMNGGFPENPRSKMRDLVAIERGVSRAGVRRQIGFRDIRRNTTQNVLEWERQLVRQKREGILLAHPIQNPLAIRTQEIVRRLLGGLTCPATAYRDRIGIRIVRVAYMLTAEFPVH